MEKNAMEKSINSMRPFFNQDPTDPKIHDTVTELFNVKQEYKHLIEKEMKTGEDHSKDLCRYVNWRVLLYTLQVAKVRDSDSDTPPIASD